MERLYTELEILNQPNIHILTAFIYVKKNTPFKKKKTETRGEIWETCHSQDHLMLQQHQKQSLFFSLDISLH